MPLGASFFDDALLLECIYLVCCTPGGVTVCGSGLCCCVPCLSSAIISLCLLSVCVRVCVCLCLFVCVCVSECV